MLQRPIKTFILLNIFAVFFHKNITAVSIQCRPAANCSITEDSEVCVLEKGPESTCIRKYPSKCHMDIAACKQQKNFTDFSSDYCAMDGFICEEGYERWTIFFGNEYLIAD